MFAPRFDITVSWDAADASPQRGNLPQSMGFSRSHTIRADGVAEAISGSSAKVFRGDASKWNPEQLLLSSLAQCHMLTFLYLAHRENIKILEYSDSASGTISMDSDGIGGQFSQITLNPKVTVETSESLFQALKSDLAEINHRVKEHCFIRRSISVPVQENLTIRLRKAAI